MKYYRNRETSRAAADAIGRTLGLDKAAREEIVGEDHSVSHSGPAVPNHVGGRK